MYLYSAVLSDNVGISIKNENLLTGLRLLTPTVSMAPNSGGATGWTGGDESPPFVTEANFLIRPNPVRKGGGGGYDSGIKSRNTGLGKFQNKRHSCSNIYINM